MEKQKKIHVLLFGLIICILYSSNLLAQQTSIIDSANQKSDSYNYKILVDNNEVLNMKEILSLKKDLSNFENLPKQFSKQIILCYLSIKPDKKRNHVFILNCPNTLDLKILSATKNDSTGALSINENSYSSFNNNFIFELPDNANTAVIKIKISKFISIDISEERKEFVFNKKRNLNILYGIALGILLLLILYHSILYFVVRENIYRYYILQLAVASVYLLANWGILKPHLHHIYHQIIHIIFFLIYITVFWAYIKSSINNKKINIIYISILPLYIILGLFDIVAPSFISKLILFIFYILLFAAFIYTTVKYYPKKTISYHCFLISWLIMFLGQFIFSSFELFQIQKSFFLNHSFEFGILVNNIMLAFAFGNNLNIYKIEKNKAEISEIEALKEKEKLVQEQKSILENLIIERNKVLLDKIKISEDQKQEIGSQNVTINNRIKEIEKINNELIQKNLEITNQNIELEKHHKILEETVEKRTKKLIKAKERAIIADKLKTSFLNNLTQEINIPMNAITGYSSIITDKELSKESRNDYLQKIIKYVDILLESVDNIVTLSRIQAGIIKSRITETSLVELINNIQLIFREKIDSSGKKINFQIQFAEIDPEMHVIADNEKIKQISNILSDTLVKQMMDGEIKITFKSFKLEHNEQKKKDKLVFNILFCVPNHTQNKIIDLFKNLIVTVDNNVKYNNHLELGLAICNGLLKILKAKSQIKNIEENYAKLKLIIPVTINFKNSN